MISQAGSVSAPQPSFRGDTPGAAPKVASGRPEAVFGSGTQGLGEILLQAGSVAAPQPLFRGQSPVAWRKLTRARGPGRRCAELRRTRPGRRSRTSGAKPREASGNTIGPRPARSTRRVRYAARSAVAAPHPRARGGPKSAAGRSCAKLRRTSPGRRSRTFGAKPREASENTTARAASTSTRHTHAPARFSRAAPHPGLPEDAGAKPHRASLNTFCSEPAPRGCWGRGATSPVADVGPDAP